MEICVEVVETLKIKDFPKIRMQDAREIAGFKILRFAQKNYEEGQKRKLNGTLFQTASLLAYRKSVFSPVTVLKELSVEKYWARMPAASSARVPPASPPSATKHRATWGSS